MHLEGIHLLEQSFQMTGEILQKTPVDIHELLMKRFGKVWHIHPKN
jgi:hypothetical protein